MLTLTVALGERSYPILIGPGLLGRAELYAEHLQARQVLVVSDKNVAKRYLARVRAALGERQVETFVVPPGETTKSLKKFGKLIDALVAHQFHRDCAVVALGGGVVGDLAGFAAACYQRGVDFVQLPTTLLAQVDSAVGGKTGVNHPDGKNLIGAFYQPRLVIADTDTLATLLPNQFRAGLAEVVKYGAIVDATFLQWLEDELPALLDRDAEALTYAIKRCCEIKAAIVAADEKEAARRALLNFGHSFGHAIEKCTGYREWLHGEAVSIGMVMAAEFSARIGSLPAGDVARLANLLARVGLPLAAPGLGAQELFEAMLLDKKVRDGKLRLVLLHALGDARIVDDFGIDALRDYLAAKVAE